MHKLMNYICEPLMIIGAINWGLIGAFNFNLVAALFGSMSVLSRIIYVIVGIAGICGIFMFGKACQVIVKNSNR